MPYPANYGGVIDVYYTVKALAERGVHINLHCFYNKRKPAPELQSEGVSVNYYKRKMGWWNHVHWLPFTVVSKPLKHLRHQLLKDQNPIIAEVLHCIHVFKDAALKHRLKIYRHSNIEHRYYKGLAIAERHWLKKMYLYIECLKLKHYESKISNANLVWAVNQSDATYFTNRYPGLRVQWIPSFNGFKKIDALPGQGTYALFHGNLEVSENILALHWIIKSLAPFQIPLVVAGNSASEKLWKSLRTYSWITCVPSPQDSELKDLIQNAQVHVLFTHQPTGLKLKLLNVLFNGRWLVCNFNMLDGTPIKPHEELGVLVSNDSIEYGQLVKNAMNVKWKANSEQRNAVLKPFMDATNIKFVLKDLFESGEMVKPVIKEC